jgi:hypothetical protein
MPVAAAIAGAAVIGGGVSLLASSKAAKTEKSIAAKNNALQTDIYNKNAATLSPFVAQGSTATKSINALLGLANDNGAANDAFNAFTNSDGYKFRLDQGAKQVQAALGAKGYLDSGAEDKALLTYGQGVGSDEFSKYLGYLTGQQGVGLTAASAQAGVGTNYANAVSANNSNAANATSNAYLSGAGAINGAIGSGLSAYGLSQGLKSSYGGANGSALTAANSYDDNLGEAFLSGGY